MAASAETQSAVDASLQKGELSYFHAFKDTRDWDYEAKAPELLAAEEDRLQGEVERLLALGPAESEAALAQAGDQELLRRAGEAWLRRGSLALAEAALSRALLLAAAPEPGAAAAAAAAEAGAEAGAGAGAGAEAVAKRARRAELHARRSEVRRGAGDVRGALEDAERCVDLRAAWAEGHLQRGQALARQERFAEADQALARAAALEGSSAGRARIAEARGAIAGRLPWGEDISPCGDGSALLRVVKRGAEAGAFAEDLCAVQCHCRLHEQSDAPRLLGDREAGRLRWSSYAEQQGVEQEYTREDDKKEPLEWVLGEDLPPFPLLDVTIRKLRSGGEAKVRLVGSGTMADGLPVAGGCDACIYLVNVAPPCSGPADVEQWCGIESIHDEARRGAELLDRAAEALRTGPPREAARLAGAAERRCGRACAWLAGAEEELCRDGAAAAAAGLRVQALCGRARALLWRAEALLAEGAGSAPHPACAGLAAASRKGLAPPTAAADVARAAADAVRAVELTGRKSADALYVHGLAIIGAGDLPSGRAVLEEALQLEPGPATTAARDALICLRTLERGAKQADAASAAASARDQLGAAVAQGDAGVAEEALRELIALVDALPYESVMSLKLGKAAATAQATPPSDSVRALAAEFIVGLRKMAMSQGRR